MAKRGRKSGASLSVISGGVTSVNRPKPPTELTDEQAVEWSAIVDRLSADWFTRENFAVLAQYCRHIVSARRLSQLIEAEEASDEFTVFKYDTLLRMQCRESATMMSLATKMRLTQQSRYAARGAAKKSLDAGTAKKPWEK